LALATAITELVFGFAFPDCPVTLPLLSYFIPEVPITPPSAVAILGESLGMTKNTLPELMKEIMFCVTCPGCPEPTVPKKAPSCACKTGVIGPTCPGTLSVVEVERPEPVVVAT